jgi:hypothetical protein
VKTKINPKILNQKTPLATVLILLLALSIAIAVSPNAGAAQTVPDRKTGAYLSTNPDIIGLNQPLTVNLWIYPSPVGPNFEGASTTALQSFDNITITFTRPDGTKDTFMPTDGSASYLGLKAGQTESIGAVWFAYNPNQIGTWTVQFHFPRTNLHLQQLHRLLRTIR